MSARRRVQLVHWNAAEARERVARLGALGVDAAHLPTDGPAILQRLEADSPAAVVIDLSRLPSHGREVGLHVRMKKATRSIPIVFVDGEPAKVERIRALLPDAGFAPSWDALGPVLKRALARPPREPHVPCSLFEQYAGRSLAQKLGIRDGAKVALVGAPGGFESTLGELPAGAATRRGARGASDLALVFVKTKAELATAATAWAKRDDVPMFWFAWPKKSAGGALSEDDIRAAILPKGLVDSKVCALDATWGALRLSRRKTPAR